MQSTRMISSQIQLPLVNIFLCSLSLAYFTFLISILSIFNKYLLRNEESMNAQVVSIGIKDTLTMSEVFLKSNNSVGEGNGTPLQYSCLENPMDGGGLQDPVHGVAHSRMQLSHFTFTFHIHALKEEMATHSSVLAWRIPGMGEPGGLPSMELHRVGHE